MNIQSFNVLAAGFLNALTRPGRTNRERGMFVSPALLGLGVFLALALAGYGVYRYISSQTSVNIETTNLLTIISGAKSLKSGGSYANVDVATLQRINAFGNMTGSSSGTPRNGWNGEVEINGQADSLTITYNGVPESACDRFVTAAMDSGEFADASPVCSESAATSVVFTAY